MVDDARRVFDYFLHEFRSLQRQFDRHAADGHAVTDDLSRRLMDLLEEQGRRLCALASAGGGGTISAQLRQHPLHREVILQSPVLRHALEKPRGYAGDMELMLKICQPQIQAPVSFAEHLDVFYRQLPAAQAVRDRIRMLGRLLDDLPPTSRVLNLACGPALEVQSHFWHRPDSTLVVDLVDHDVETLRYLSGRVPGDRVRLLQGNAFRLLAGDLGVRPYHPDAAHPEDKGSNHRTLGQNYDLIYSAGLYDYIPDSRHGQGGVTALTAVLAGLLKPGGRLLVGNYLRPSPGSRHQPHHRAMMELYSSWHLRYRDVEQIRAFTAAVNRPHRLDLLDETGQRLRSAGESVIGFAALHAR